MYLDVPGETGNWKDERKAVARLSSKTNSTRSSALSFCWFLIQHPHSHFSLRFPLFSFFPFPRLRPRSLFLLVTKNASMLKSKPQTPSRAHRPPPLLLSHVKTSPTLRHPHPTLLPSPLSEWNSFPAIQASTWDEVEKREVRLERERVNGRRARGRSIVQDVEWGLLEEDFNQKVSKSIFSHIGNTGLYGSSYAERSTEEQSRMGKRLSSPAAPPLSPSLRPSAFPQRQRHESLATGTLVPPPHLETRRISLGFQETLTPVLPTVVRPLPGPANLLLSSPELTFPPPSLPPFLRDLPRLSPPSSPDPLPSLSSFEAPRK